MPPTGNSDAVVFGPGTLYWAPIGTSEPTSASAALPSAWTEIGYTEDGSEFQYEITNEGVEVAEEFDPIKYGTTARRGSVSFQMAELTRQHLALALNAVTEASAGDSGDSFEPNAVGSEERLMLVWDKDATANGEKVRWIFRKCFQGDPITTAHRKAPQKALLPVTFRLEVPSDGSETFIVYPDANGLVA